MFYVFKKNIHILSFFVMPIIFFLIINAFDKKEMFLFCSPAFAEKNEVKLKTKPCSLLILNTMPKSGSMHISKSLAKILSTTVEAISYNYFPTDTIDYFKVKSLAEGNKIIVTQTHINPSVNNMQTQSKFCDKIMLHVRHPLQATLSMIHNNDMHIEKGSIDLLYYLAPAPPKESYNWSLENKIDWYIENYLPSLNSWLLEWMTYIEKSKKSKPKFKILVTDYRELKKDEIKFFTKLLNFYDIPFDNGQYIPLNKDKTTHFRKGLEDEWKTVFSAVQIKRAKTKIDPKVLKYFGWKI